MGVEPADTLTVEMGEVELRVWSLSSAIKRVQAGMREINRVGRRLVDGLMANPRARAAAQ